MHVRTNWFYFSAALSPHQITTSYVWIKLLLVRPVPLLIRHSFQFFSFFMITLGCLILEISTVKHLLISLFVTYRITSVSVAWTSVLKHNLDKLMNSVNSVLSHANSKRPMQCLSLILIKLNVIRFFSS